MPRATSSYVDELKRRAKESHVYRKYQLMGLAIAEALKDERHKSLYIKLAKERGGEALLALAKDVAERRGVKNRGAYFMALIAKTAPPTAPRRSRTSRKHAS